jgi:hypothetical protein
MSANPTFTTVAVRGPTLASRSISQASQLE